MVRMVRGPAGRDHEPNMRLPECAVCGAPVGEHDAHRVDVHGQCYHAECVLHEVRARLGARVRPTARFSTG
jgi:hypothetical protein